MRSSEQVVLDLIEDQLLNEYGIDISERNFIHGVYNQELERFAKGLWGDLRQSAPDRFREKQIEFLQGKIANRGEHLRASLDHVAKGRHKQIILFLDNADQRDSATQQALFLIAHELAAHWPATIFVTLRPETFHSSVRNGALSGYHPKAFTIYPPRIEQVIEKRLRFANRIAAGQLPLSSLPTGLQVRLSNLESLVSAFVDSLSTNRELVELIDNISGGNVRLALNLVRSFFGSGHVDTAKIVDIYTERESYTIPVHEFLRAIIYGDKAHYDPGSSPLANVFDVAYADPKEHFLLPILMGILQTYSGAESEEGFVETSVAYQHVQGLGFLPEQIDAALMRAHQHKLIETAGRRIPQAGETMPAALRVTSVGAYHLTRLVGLFAYVDAMIVDSPVFDQDRRAQIHDVRDILSRLDRAVVFCQYLDDQWPETLDGQDFFRWPPVSRELQTAIPQIERRARKSMEA